MARAIGNSVLGTKIGPSAAEKHIIVLWFGVRHFICSGRVSLSSLPVSAWH